MRRIIRQAPHLRASVKGEGIVYPSGNRRHDDERTGVDQPLVCRLLTKHRRVAMLGRENC